MSRRRKKKRLIQGTITRHRGFWCLRFRERIRVGSTIKTVQRSKRLAPIDEEHKTRKSVESLADIVLEPINKAPAQYVAIQLEDFMEGKIPTLRRVKTQAFHLSRVQADVAAISSRAARI